MLDDMDLILAQEIKDGDVTVFLTSQKGRDYVADRLRRLWPDVQIKEMPGRLEYVVLTPRRAKVIYRHTAGEKAGIERYWWMPPYGPANDFFEIALLARHIAAEQRKSEAVQAINAYYGPKIRAAIEARDKREITKLLSRFPNNVEKACIMSGLMYGKDAFPELKKEGVTIQNWFDVEP